MGCAMPSCIYSSPLRVRRKNPVTFLPFACNQLFQPPNIHKSTDINGSCITRVTETCIAVLAQKKLDIATITSEFQESRTALTDRFKKARLSEPWGGSPANSLIYTSNNNIQKFISYSNCGTPLDCRHKSLLSLHLR